MKIFRYISIFFILSLLNLNPSLSFTFNNLNSFQLKTKFTDVSFRQGLKHIHTPEHVKYTHYIGAPLFNIHTAQKPINYNNITSISFSCSVMNLNHMTVMMHSEYTNRCEMNFLIKNKEFITLQITILPDFENKNNHYFILKIFLNDFLSLFLPIIKIFFQLSMFISTNEDLIFYFNKKNKIIYNKNLNEYRKLILKNFKKINKYKTNHLL